MVTLSNIFGAVQHFLVRRTIFSLKGALESFCFLTPFAGGLSFNSITAQHTSVKFLNLFNLNYEHCFRMMSVSINTVIPIHILAFHGNFIRSYHDQGWSLNLAMVELSYFYKKNL